LKSPGEQPIGAIASCTGSPSGSSVNGAYRSPPAPGVGVTTTWSVLVSTRHRSLDLPSPSRSFIAIAAPTDEIQAWIRSYSLFTGRIVCCLSAAGSAIVRAVNPYLAAVRSCSAAETVGRLTTK
jgi:hypothetical protein